MKMKHTLMETETKHAPAGIASVFEQLQQRLSAWRSLDWVAIAPADTTVEAIREAANKFQAVTEEAVAACNKKNASRGGVQTANPGEFAEATILLAEDNVVNRMVAEGMLQQFQCSIDMAENGEQAVELFQKKSYDVIFMDCQMPVMDGYQAVAEIRAIESSDPVKYENRTPIVALTANALKGDRDRCIDAGMDDYVSKPFAIADLRGALERRLGVDRTSTIRALRSSNIENTASRANVPMHKERFVDTKVLDAIRRLTKSDGGKLLEKVASVFLSSSPRLVDDLVEALTELDGDVVKRAAHTLRSSCGSIGAIRLVDICKSIESLRGRLTEAEAEEWKSQLQLCHSQTCNALRELVPKGVVE